MKLKLAMMALAAAMAIGAADTASAGERRGGGWHGPKHKVPEIDLFSGLAAMATLGGAGALVMERRRRKADSAA